MPEITGKLVHPRPGTIIIADVDPPPKLSAYLGVDPGASGGFALVTLTGELLQADKMPDTEQKVWDWIRTAEQNYRLWCTLEKVQGFAGNEASGGNGPSMFKFGSSYGGLRMALVSARIPFDAVTPQAWQRAFDISPRNHRAGEKSHQFKNRLKAKAQELFPERIITLGTADAILLAEFCRRNRGGGLVHDKPVGATLF